MNTADILKPGASVLRDKGDFKLIGRDDALASLINILTRRSAHNVVLVGVGGAGCSSLCVGLQQAKTDPNTPFDIVHKRMWWLDTDGLFSDTEKVEEQFEALLNKVSNTADKDTVLIIEDAVNFIDAAVGSGNGHFINRMMRHLEQGRFQVIFEGRDTELDKIMACHSSMSEVFTVMELTPPNDEQLRDIVNASAASLSEYHGIRVESSAVEQAIHLTTTYPGKERSLMRSQPEASLTLLDRALATYKNVSHSNPPEVESLKSALSNAPDNIALKQRLDEANAQWAKRRSELMQASEDQAYGEELLIGLEKQMAALQAEKSDSDGLAMSSREMQELGIKISETRKLVKANSERYSAFSKEINSTLALTGDHVFREFSKLSGIPFDKLNEDEDEKLVNLPTELKKQVFGQDHVIERVSNALLMSRTPGLKEPGKPDLAVMFCGPSGTGKTELAKALARILKDDERAMLRFDMSEYSEKNNVTSLVGAPPGYAGYEEGGILTNAARKNPNGIFLFDEIEKAHTSIFDIFLQVLDDGRLTDTQGLTVSFEHAILIFTTNTGAKHMLDESKSYEEQRAGTMEDLSSNYRAEFLNRFDGRQNIVMFKTLQEQIIHMIARRSLDKVNERLQKANVDMLVRMDESNISRMCKEKYNTEHGARGIEGVFRTDVFPGLAHILKSSEKVNRVDVAFDNGEFKLSPSYE